MLDHVRTHGESSRAELAQATGLGRSVLTQRVDALRNYGLLADDRVGVSTGGRAPRLLRFRSDAGYLLVADLGATSTDVALADLAGRIVVHRQEPSDIAAGPEAVLARVEQLFEECVAEAGGDRSLWGIGSASLGRSSSSRPTGLAADHAGLGRLPPARAICRARRPGLGRQRRQRDGARRAHGRLRPRRRRLRLRQDRHRIGAGIVVDGRIHRGAKGSAGDVGHIHVPAGREVTCRCGMSGCLEAFAGGLRWRATPRRRRATAAAGSCARCSTRRALDAADVAAACKHGDPVSIELITEAGRLIGQMLTGIVNFFNPSLIVIGGGVAGAGDLCSRRSGRRYRRSLPLATRDLTVRRSALDGRAGVIGAATMAANELFAREYLPRWLPAGSPACSA